MMRVARVTAFVVAALGAGCGSSSNGSSGGGGDAGTTTEAGVETGSPVGVDASADEGAPDVSLPWDAGVTASGTQISQYGITWTLRESATYGTFANGDYWVVGPVTITSISPATTTTGGRTTNGWDVNPLPSNPQGYDTCASDYSASDVPSLPYAAMPGSSIVQTVSEATPVSGASPACLKTAAVLTVVDQAPPDNGATVFRPTYVGPKAVPMTYRSVKDVDWSLLPSLTPAGSVMTYAPDLSMLPTRLARVQLDHMNGRWSNVGTYDYTGYPNANINPVDNMSNYGPIIARENNDAMLRLTLNDPLSAKLPVAIALIQGGIDRFAMLENGQFWPSGSGMMEGRKMSIAFAAVMLGDQAMEQSITAASSVGGTNFFLEDGEIGVGYEGHPIYGGGVAGMNGCLDPYQPCSSPGFAYYWSWDKMTMGANDGSGDPYLFLDGSQNGMQGGDNYQPINSPPFQGAALLGLLIPSIRAIWGHPEFFEYADRWADHGVQAQPDPCAPLSAGGGPDPTNPGGCVLDPNLVAGSTMEHFACQAGKTCGRWPAYDGTKPDSGNGSYQSTFANAMWAAYRNASSASVYTWTMGAHGGTVTSSPAGISCGSTCGASFPTGTTVTLTASPAAGATFSGWSGACSGTGPCTLTLSAVSTSLPSKSACAGFPAGIVCSSPPTANVTVTALFE